MKRYLHFALAALLFLCVSSCGEKDVPGTLPEVQLSVSPETLAFESADKSNKIISVTAEGPWTAKSSADWIIVSPASGNGNGSVTVSVAENSNSERSGSVTIADAKISKTVSVTQESSGVNWIVPAPDPFSGRKMSSATYQLLIYSFADSDGDGIGDFKGIQSKLDYLDALGVTALWLSPAHPTSSYHAYDVDDYRTVNPLYGSEDDFKALIDAAHERGIAIYMDFVLNHSGSNNRWFKDACSDPESHYRDYYVFSDNPTADVAAGKIDNYAGAKNNGGMGEWHEITIGEAGYWGRLHFKVDWTGSTKYVTVTESKEAAQKSNPSATKWLWIGSSGNVGLYETASGIFEITLDVDTDWGFLVRSSNSDSWPAGTKYGAPSGSGPLKLGEAFKLDNSGSCGDITFGGSKSYYFSSFSGDMPDLNYGKYTDCETSPAFKAIAASADHWIDDCGVDGFRLDAVLWIYQNQTDANVRFLQQWYDRCNTVYHAVGHTEDIFMVGEAWENHGKEKLYYKGIPSCFEFDYWGALKTAVGGNASNYASTVVKFIEDHFAQRPGSAITSFHMTNHDQDRAASDLGKNLAKEKQAAAMLLTSGGKPFIYQGEELGYWGTKANGDEYVRTPIMWDKAGRDCARRGVNNKVDNSMLNAEISVEAQLANESSLLNVYRTWGSLRNTYRALGNGSMSTTSAVSGGGNAIAAWMMTFDLEPMLVIHNCAGLENTVTVSVSMDKPVALLGTASYKGDKLTLGPHSSVVFKLY
ncbi:MAG: alpha-amylase [Bacteroidales bacterium]|nr:alpha-amylase [Bacteroidales bacterium]